MADGRTPAVERSEQSERVTESALTISGGLHGITDFEHWWSDRTTRADARRIPLEELSEWRTEVGTGRISHNTGQFFSVEGLDVTAEGSPVPHWQQPIIVQPETGILGLLATDVDGVLHFLLQAKAEPGNRNGVQLSPTVQATRSNYTGVHRGSSVPYLSYFQSPPPDRVLVDVRQSEQGSWFYRKRNRNMILRVPEYVEATEGFYWLTLGQIYALLAEEDLVNMDMRSVLSCLTAAVGLTPSLLPRGVNAFQDALVRSLSRTSVPIHTDQEILGWITDIRGREHMRVEKVSLDGLHGWHRGEGRISHESGRFFDVIGVEVTAVGREVRQWAQPMVAPNGTGVIAFLTAEFDGVLHVLTHQRAEPGFLDVTELAPTVQCVPESYEVLSAQARPPYLDAVLGAAPDRVRYDVLLSEEGGRFHHALNRYLVVEAEDPSADVPFDYHWMTPRQLLDLLSHSHYVNVQARTLLACLGSLAVR